MHPAVPSRSERYRPAAVHTRTCLRTLHRRGSRPAPRAPCLPDGRPGRTACQRRRLRPEMPLHIAAATQSAHAFAARPDRGREEDAHGSFNGFHPAPRILQELHAGQQLPYRPRDGEKQKQHHNRNRGQRNPPAARAGAFFGRQHSAPRRQRPDTPAQRRSSRSKSTTPCAAPGREAPASDWRDARTASCSRSCIRDLAWPGGYRPSAAPRLPESSRTP